MTTPRRLLLRAGASALMLPVGLRALAANSPARIGYLLSGSSPQPSQRLRYSTLLTEELKKLGWLEGGNLLIERRYAENDLSRLPELARDLARLQLDLIVAPENPAIRATLQATSTIPIVSVVAIDPVGQGYAMSLHRPGKNVTGLLWDQNPEITAKYPELLKELNPGLKRLGCIIQPTYPGIEPYRAALESASARLSIEARHAEIRSAEDLEPAFASLVAARVEALFAYASPIVSAKRSTFLALAARHKLPDMQIYRAIVDEGSLMSYGVDITDMYRRAAGYVDKILKGANPAEMPFEQPTRYEMVINKKRADALGLKIPPLLLLRADEVIE